MLSLTRNEPSRYSITEHKDEVKMQLLVEAKAKLFALCEKQNRMEKQKILGVQDTLLLNEISNRIQKAHRLIERLEGRSEI